MSAQTHRSLNTVLILAFAVGLCYLVRSRHTTSAHSQQTQEAALTPVIDHTTALYHALYPDAQTLHIDVVGRKDGQWAVECQESDTDPSVTFTWDAATLELLRCSPLRLPLSDRKTFMTNHVMANHIIADHTIADTTQRTKRMAWCWLKHLGLVDEGWKGNLSYLAKQWPQSRVRLVSYETTTRKILMGVDSVSGDLAAFYSRPSASFSHAPTTLDVSN